jgi:hypothetical protein
VDEGVLLGGGFALILIGALYLRTLFVDPLRLSRPTRFLHAEASSGPLDLGGGGKHPDGWRAGIHHCWTDPSRVIPHVTLTNIGMGRGPFIGLRAYDSSHGLLKSAALDPGSWSPGS